MKYIIFAIGSLVLLTSILVWKFPVMVQNWFADHTTIVHTETEFRTINTNVEAVHEMGTPRSEQVAEHAAPVSAQAVSDEVGELVVGERNDEIFMETNSSTAMAETIATMMVAGGCFWCVEADLEKLPGVIEVVSGYAGGTTDNPTYQNYKSGGHREVVEVTYDPTKVSYEEILIYAMKHMDPTDDDGSFYDRGDGYSPAFYHETAEQKAIIDRLITEVNENGPYEKPLAIDVEQRPTFWPAEDYHQDYYQGTLSGVKYKAYRTASGRDRFIRDTWGDDTGAELPWRESETAKVSAVTGFWTDYQKPNRNVLKQRLDPIVYKVTQEDGTERAGTSPLDKVYEPGIYVDILSGEPLFSSRDKFDSGTGWPSFVAPITPTAVTEHEDRKLFTVRTEIRSAIADNHLGHVFNDGPADRGGLRYCMNGAALEFVPEADMAARGYGDYLSSL